MSAILKVWRHILNPTPSVDAYIHSRNNPAKFIPFPIGFETRQSINSRPLWRQNVAGRLNAAGTAATIVAVAFDASVDEPLDIIVRGRSSKNKNENNKHSKNKTSSDILWDQFLIQKVHFLPNDDPIDIRPNPSVSRAWHGSACKMLTSYVAPFWSLLQTITLTRLSNLSGTMLHWLHILLRLL